tara:strand:- start:350 stop:541 length:192 start_codon:yes stop_codon:yes gene_type:complete
MKPSGAPDTGDLVVAKEDFRRNIFCPGLIIDCRGIECYIMWSSENNPLGWWPRRDLEVINEDR